MAQQRRKTPAKPRQQPAQIKTFTIFGGDMFSLSFGGGGRRGRRRRKSLAQRAAGFFKGTVQQTIREMNGKAGGGSGRAPAARSAPRTVAARPSVAADRPPAGTGGQSFEEFQAEHPDLFEGPPVFDISVDSDVDDDQGDEDEVSDETP